MAVIKNKDKKDILPKSREEWLLWIISGVLTLICALGPNLIDLIRDQINYRHEMDMYKMKNTIIQHFYSETEAVENFGMEFVKYKIKSEPAVKGYHVIMYPYVVCEKENKEMRIIAVEGQFMQDEYVADEEGRCTLLRENTTDDLIQTVEAEATMNFFVDVKCLAAVKYVENDEERIEIFDLKDGQLTESTEDTAIRVLEAWQEKNKMKIDVKGWPDYNKSNLNDIFS